MFNSASPLFRSLLIYSVCLPLAIVLGYLLANPDIDTFRTVGVVLFVLMLPLFLRWHHTWLIISWNMSVMLFFLPGRPEIWLVMCFISITISVGQYILNRKNKFLDAPSVTMSLIFLGMVVLVTAVLTRSIGLRIMGSDTYGGRKYIQCLAGIIGYFALTSQRITPSRVNLFVTLFFLGNLTQVFGEMARFVAPSFYFIYLIFPISSSGLIAILGSPTAAGEIISRFGGISFASASIFYAMLARYGISEVFNLRKFWRFALFLVLVAFGTVGGFRSLLILFILTFAILFYLEGLMHSRLLPMLILVAILGGAGLFAAVDRLPLGVQRTFSFLPLLPVNPVAKMDAQASTEWRLAIWQHLIPQIPRYLLVGKGLGISPDDVEVTRKVTTADAETQSELAGDFHNGPLSVIITFGIFGVIGFLWFLIAGFRVLRKNFYFGDPLFRRVNAFLFAYFVAKIIFFMGVGGALYGDLASFTVLVGLSLSVNGGVSKPVTALEPQPAQSPLALRSPGRKIVSVGGTGISMRQ